MSSARRGESGELLPVARVWREAGKETPRPSSRGNQRTQNFLKRAFRRTTSGRHLRRWALTCPHGWKRKRVREYGLAGFHVVTTIDPAFRNPEIVLGILRKVADFQRCPHFATPLVALPGLLLQTVLNYGSQAHRHLRRQRRSRLAQNR